MYPPIYPPVAASAAVKALLGNVPRFFSFGEADQGTAKPYAVWQTISGGPENYLGTSPDADRWRVQVDAYAATPAQARAVAEAIQLALEAVAYVVSYGAEQRDFATRAYRAGFDVEFIQSRASATPTNAITTEDGIEIITEDGQAVVTE